MKPSKKLSGSIYLSIILATVVYATDPNEVEQTSNNLTPYGNKNQATIENPGKDLSKSPYLMNPEVAPFNKRLVFDQLPPNPDLNTLQVRLAPENNSSFEPPFRHYPTLPFDISGADQERLEKAKPWDNVSSDPNTLIAAGIGYGSYKKILEYLFIEGGSSLTPEQTLLASAHIALSRPTVSAGFIIPEKIKKFEGPSKKNLFPELWYGLGFIFEVPYQNIYTAKKTDAHVLEVHLEDKNISDKAFRNALLSHRHYDKGESPESFGPDINTQSPEELLHTYANEIAFHPQVTHNGKLYQAKIIALFIGEGRYEYLPKTDDSEFYDTFKKLATTLKLPLLDLRFTEED